MAPEKIKVTEEMLSTIQLEIYYQKRIMLFIIEIYNIIYQKDGY